jgi:hypothetical protein
VILSRVRVTTDGVWIGNRIYWTIQHTTCEYTLQITITHRLVFSVTVFTALLGNAFQQWTFLCFRTQDLAGWRPSHVLLTTASRLLRNGSWSSLYSLGTDCRETPFPTITPLLCVTQPLPNNSCFSGSTVLALRKYAAY